MDADQIRRLRPGLMRYLKRSTLVLRGGIPAFICPPRWRDNCLTFVRRVASRSRWRLESPEELARVSYHLQMGCGRSAGTELVA